VNAALWLMMWVAQLAAAAQAADGEGARWAQAAVAEAVAASVSIQDPFHAAQSFAQIAEAQVGLGDEAATLALLQTASDAAGNIDKGALASWAWHDIALAYVKAGELSRAEVAAGSIKDARLRDAVFASVVDARRANHEYAAALAAARRIQDGARQGQALRSIVIAQASAGDVESALATARSIVHAGFSAVALGDVAGAFAKEGEFAEARTLVSRIRDDKARSDALAEIAAAQADARDLDGALVTANGIEDKLARAQAFARVAAARARSGRGPSAHELFAQALALAKGARGSADRKGFAFMEIARAQISAQENAGARESIRLALASLKDVKRHSERLTLIVQIAPIQARLGDHAGAMATASRADDSSLRPLLVRDVASSQAEAGDVAGAVRAASSLDDWEAGAAAYFGILRVQSQARDSAGMRATIETALQTVRVIHSDELRAGALGSLAAARLMLGDREAASTLFDEAMAIAARVKGAPARAAAYTRIADALAERGR
jgi:tetratricopeptide (TPR) repeat protein